MKSHFKPKRPPTLCVSRCLAMLSGKQASTADALMRLEKVLNARDLASATPRIAPGRVFRAGNPANGTTSDVSILRQQLNIRQMLDFRSAEEQKEDRGWSLMLSNGVMKSYDRNGQLTEVSIDTHSELGDLSLPQCSLHRISLLERQAFIKALIWRLPPLKVVQAASYRLLGMHESMRDVLVPEINKGGLFLVYEILLSSAQADIRAALEIVANAAEEHIPQLLFCKLGKDRTGLMTALVLSCCGATDEEIISDYVKSDGVNEVALGGLEKMKDVAGMEKDLFARAPPEAMKAILAHVQEKYGGFTEYMESIGFCKDRQAAVARALSPETEW